MNSVLIPLKIS